MNSTIRFLTFQATRPTYFYETRAYLAVRCTLAAFVLVASLLASSRASAPWLVMSAFVAVVGAWAAQVARSGASRRDEKRKKIFAGDVKLPCDAELARAAALGSLCASMAPVVALGSALSGARSGALVGWALAASLLASLQSAFDVAWSLWIYPAWRRRYTAERDRLRKELAKGSDVDAVLSWSAPVGFRPADVLSMDMESIQAMARDVDRAYPPGRDEPEDAPVDNVAGRTADVFLTIDRAKEEGDVVMKIIKNRDSGFAGSPGSPPFIVDPISLLDPPECDEPEDAPTALFTRKIVSAAPYGRFEQGHATHETDEHVPQTQRDGRSDDGFSYVRCDSLDDLIAKTKRPAPEGTRLYTTDDSPCVEYGGLERGWFVDWLDGSTSPADVLRFDAGREQFLAMAEGRDA
jgi:hypothetical protein